MADSAGSKCTIGSAGIRLASQSVRRRLQEVFPLAQRWVESILHTQEGIGDRIILSEISALTSGSNISNQRRRSSNRASSSAASKTLGRSRSTPGLGRTPREVTRRKRGDSNGSCRLSGSSSVLAMNALTLMPWADASRRTYCPDLSTIGCTNRLFQPVGLHFVRCKILDVVMPHVKLSLPHIATMLASGIMGVGFNLM